MDEPRRPFREIALFRRVQALGLACWSLLVEKRRFLGSSVARASSVALQTLLAFAISHLFGLGTLGQYYLITTWASLLGTVLCFGASEYYLMREVAHLEAAGRINAARATLLHALGVACVPFVLIIVALSLNPEISSRILVGTSDKIAFVLYLGPIAWVLAMRRIFAQVLKGRGKPELGFLIEYSLPTFIMLVVVVTHRVFLGPTLSPERIFSIAFVAEFIGLVIGAWLVLMRWRGNDAYESRYNFALSLKMGLAVVMQALFLNVVFIILPRYVGSDDIGTFGLCTRIAGVAMIFLEAVISVYSPGFSVLMRQHKIQELKVLYSRARRNLWTSCIPILIAVLFLAKPILMLFNANREGAALILILLTFARFSEAAFGPVSFFLWMVGRESVEAAATFLGVLITLSSIFFIGPSGALLTITIFYLLAYCCRVVLDWIYISRNVFGRPPDGMVGRH
jgi:O-antigen/teichoic acid export membrane protein